METDELLPYEVGGPSDLAAADLEAVFGAAGELAEVRRLDDLRRDALDIVDALVPSQLISWNELVLGDGPAVFRVTMKPDLAALVPPDRLDELNRAFAAHIAQHPAITYVDRTADGRPRTISDYLGTDEFHLTPLYKEFYSQPEIAVEDQLSLTLPQPEMVIGIALNRSQRDFTARDRLVLNLLRPHIVQAIRNAVAFERSQLIISGMESAVQSDHDGLLLLGADSRIEHMIGRARELIDAFFPRSEGSALPPALVSWLASPDRPHAPEWPLVVERDGRHLLVRRLPGDGAQALLLSVAPKQPGANDLRRLGLTRRQAEVMALVNQGRSTKEVAAALNISPRTVDKHVEQALRTLGATTRLEAVNLIRQAEWQLPG